jgi:hypothetical protein
LDDSLRSLGMTTLKARGRESSGGRGEGVMMALEMTGKYFGSSRPVRIVLLVLISLVAGSFELFLLLIVTHLPPTFPFPVPMMSYWLPLVHLLPLFAGLTYWRKVRHALVKGEISATAAELSYSVIIALLLVTYVVLANFEIALLPWAVG